MTAFIDSYEFFIRKAEEIAGAINNSAIITQKP